MIAMRGRPYACAALAALMASLIGCGQPKTDEPPPKPKPTAVPRSNSKPSGLGLLHIKVDDEGRVLRCRFTAHDPDPIAKDMGDRMCGKLDGEKVAESIQRAPNSKRDFVIDLPYPPIVQTNTPEEREARRRSTVVGS